MALQPVIEGMLGLAPDAPANKLFFSPEFPAHWDTVSVNNIRMGKHLIDFKFERNDNIIRYTFVNRDNKPLTVGFSPSFPKGCRIESKYLDGKMLRPTDHGDTIIFTLDHQHTLEYRYKYGVEVLPFIPHSKPGYRPEGLRIISDKLTNNVYEINLQALSGNREEFRVYIHGHHPVKTEKAERIARKGDIYRFKIDFPAGDEKYTFQTVRIYLD